MNNRLSLRGMKLLKVFHLIFIMMWTIGVIIMALLNWKSENQIQTFIYNQKTSLFIDYVLVIPGAVCGVVTGLIYGLKTNWGFFKYKWITVKWIIGICVIIVGTFFLHPIALNILKSPERLIADDFYVFLKEYGTDILILQIMATLQGIALIFLVAISVFKPWMKKKH